MDGVIYAGDELIKGADVFVILAKRQNTVYLPVYNSSNGRANAVKNWLIFRLK